MNPAVVLARSLVAVYGTADPMMLIRRFGIIYFEVPLPARIRGFSVMVLDYDAICINNAITGLIRRYVQAHELGHCLLGHSFGIRFHLDIVPSQAQGPEYDAAMFAETLLDLDSDIRRDKHDKP